MIRSRFIIAAAVWGVWTGVGGATATINWPLGDYTANSLHLGYLSSGILFTVLIAIPALAWKYLRLNDIADGRGFHEKAGIAQDHT